jgi:phosphoglycolate phosphatase
MQHISLVITDLDNTLYDWFSTWYTAFRAMLDEIIRISGLPENVLIPEIKAVHERYGTSEYAFLINELPSLRERHPGENLVEVYGTAIEAYREGRRATLALYDGVRAALATISNAGTLLVGYTESRWYYTRRRLQKLDLDESLDFVYSPPDHELPRSREEIRTMPAAEYDLRRTQHRLLKEGELKPNPAVLRHIIGEVGGDPGRTIYIGDDLVKDVSMARDVGVTAVWAEYGVAQKDDRYDLLRSVTHWTKEAVERQRAATNTDHCPDLAILRFDELLTHFVFTAFRPTP